MMSNASLSAMVPDYINGHLDAQQTEAMEVALETDAALRQQVHFETMLSQSLRDSQGDPLTHVPQFRDVRKHIEGTANTPTSWLGWGMPVAACLLMMVFAINQLAPPSPAVQTFETLSDTPVSSAGNLRIILTPDSTIEVLEALVAQYQLEIVASYPEAGAVDVRLSRGQQQVNLAQEIAADTRVLQVSTHRSKP